MKKYIEKLKASTLNLDWWVTKGNRHGNLPHPGWNHRGENQKGCALSKCIIFSLAVIAFLSLGIYFIVADVKLFNAVVDEKEANAKLNSTEILISGEFEQVLQLDSSSVGNLTSGPAVKDVTTIPPKGQEEEEESVEDTEDPNLIVRLDYVDLSEDYPTDGHLIENILPLSNGTKETLIILKNDDSGKKIYLKTSAVFRDPDFPPGADEETETPTSTEEAVDDKKENKPTTPKAFVYSPTIPQATTKKIKLDATTKKYNNTEDSGCFSTKLSFCEGILPYDVVTLPNLPSVKRYSDLLAILPYFQMIIDSGCSLRAREFICSILEPECQPEGQKLSLPCKLNCKVVNDDCKDFILQTLPLSKIFDCRRYPDWDESEDCVNVAKGERCHEEEFQCSDGTCIPQKWVCDGVHDCPGPRPSFDESNCQGCAQNEFRCSLDGKCIPLHWKCDGEIDCTDHSDETSC